jgi:hypothetical protein
MGVVDADTFDRHINEYRFWYPTKAAFLDHDVDYEQRTCLVADSGLGGVVVTDDGELSNLFAADCDGAPLVLDAIEAGADHLNCFDTGLVEYYERFGFFEVDRVEWDESLAPDEWDYEQYGRPDVVFMER